MEENEKNIPVNEKDASGAAPTEKDEAKAGECAAAAGVNESESCTADKKQRNGKCRKELEKDISSIYRMLEENSKRASFEASKKLKQVRRHLSVDYFTDYKFIEKQQKAFNKEHRDEENLKAYLAKKK